MNKLSESEELYLLRFRYGRTAEMFIAYKTFLSRQVITGEKKVCPNDEIVRQVSHTLLVTFYSYIYSLFDKSGTNFINTIKPYENALSENGKKISAELISVWSKYETPITKLRHNIGFHGGTKIKSHEVGYSALEEIHPQIPEFIMNHLALLFVELDDTLPPKENYKSHITPEQRNYLFNKADKLREQINNNNFSEMIDGMKKLYSDES